MRSPFLEQSALMLRVMPYVAQEEYIFVNQKVRAIDCLQMCKHPAIGTVRRNR